jgi:diacylglycerol kinase family enzyme
VKKVSRTQVPLLIGKYKDGRYRELHDVAQYIKAESVKVICDKPTPINMDGELRTATEVEMTVAKEKIRFFYPKGLTFRAKEPALTK